MLSERLAYHRLETDGEFRTRVAQKTGIFLGSTGPKLDDDVWRYFSMQRRIVFIPVS